MLERSGDRYFARRAKAGRYCAVACWRTARTGGLRVAEFVRLEVEDGVGTIRLDRPPMNAMNRQVRPSSPGCGERGARPRRRPGGDRLRRPEDVRRRRGHQGDGRRWTTPRSPKFAPELTGAIAAIAEHAQADRRRDHRLRAGRRLELALACDRRSPATTSRSASRRSCSASSRARAAPSDWPG